MRPGPWRRSARLCGCAAATRLILPATRSLIWAPRIPPRPVPPGDDPPRCGPLACGQGDNPGGARDEPASTAPQHRRRCAIRNPAQLGSRRPAGTMSRPVAPGWRRQPILVAATHRHGPDRRDRHHQPRHHPAPAAVRDRLAARTALPPVHHQESPDPQKPPRRPGRDPAAPAPAARHHAGRAAERAASSLTRDPAIPARHRRAGMPACPRCRKRPQEHGLPRTGASAGPPARTRLTKSNRNSSRTAPTRPVAGYKT